MRFKTISIGESYRKRHALQIHYYKHFNGNETILYRRKAYKKARWRKAETRALIRLQRDVT